MPSMGYTVTSGTFEGPFDLLLHLVARQKLDVRTISIREVTDQYLAFVQRLSDLDLDVASDFLLIAATLLEIKALSLLPQEIVLTGDDSDDLSPEEARELLVARLLAYRQFKSVALELSARMEAQSRMHPRYAGLEADFVGLMPDYLKGTTLHNLAVICADLVHKREAVRVQVECVVSAPISLEAHMGTVLGRVRKVGRIGLSELLGRSPSAEIVVVTFLALLELYKDGVVSLSQGDVYGEIVVTDGSDVRGNRR